MKRFLALLVASLFVLTSCSGIFDTVIGAPLDVDSSWVEGTNPFPPPLRDPSETGFSGGYTEDFGEDGATAEVTDIGFEHVEDNLETNITVTCTEGTPNAFKLEDGVLTFTGLKKDSVYTLSGNLGGYILVDIGIDYDLELVLDGVIIQCSAVSPVIVKSGNKFKLSAKNDTTNFIYDLRDAVDSSIEGVYAGAIHAECDMQIGGKGSLTVESKNNNGIHTKDDLEVQNLDLTVTCIDNALKGNDSVTVESGNIAHSG